MEVNQKNEKKATHRSKRFEKILRDELKNDVAQQLVAEANPKLARFISALQRQGERVSVARAVNLAQIFKALQGELKAYETIRDTIGEKPGGERSDGTGNVLRVVVEDAGNC